MFRRKSEPVFEGQTVELSVGPVVNNCRRIITWPTGETMGWTRTLCALAGIKYKEGTQSVEIQVFKNPEGAEKHYIVWPGGLRHQYWSEYGEFLGKLPGKLFV